MPPTAKGLAVSLTMQVLALAIAFITALFSDSLSPPALCLFFSIFLSLSLSLSPATVVDESKTKVTILIMLQLDALHAPISQRARSCTVP